MPNVSARGVARSSPPVHIFLDARGLLARLRDNHTKVTGIEGPHACWRVHCGIYGRFVEAGSFLVARVMPGSAGEEAGVEAGMEVRGVDGRDWRAWLRCEGQHWAISSPHFRRAVRRFIPWCQPQGTRLELDTDEGARTVCFEASYPGFFHHTCSGKPEVLVFRRVYEGRYQLRVRYFPTDDTFVGRCKEALASMPEGAELELDLRGNGGGNGEAARELASMLLPEGTALSRVRGRHVGGGFTPWVTLRTTTPPVYAGPVTVLMDELCGSSTECLLGALKAAGRARLVGRRSGGSSGNARTYQTAGGVNFLCSSWEELTPEGEPIEGRGITTQPWLG